MRTISKWIAVLLCLCIHGEESRKIQAASRWKRLGDYLDGASGEHADASVLSSVLQMLPYRCGNHCSTHSGHNWTAYDACPVLGRWGAEWKTYEGLYYPMPEADEFLGISCWQDKPQFIQAIYDSGFRWITAEEAAGIYGAAEVVAAIRAVFGRDIEQARSTLAGARHTLAVVAFG